MSPLDALDEDEWDLVLDTNLKGMFVVTQEIYKRSGTAAAARS